MRSLAVVLVCGFLMGCASESSMYNRAVVSNDIGLYRNYLEKYPDGVHAEEAQTRIDEVLWNHASESNTMEDYLNYLEESPEGSHRGAANRLARARAYEEAEAADTLELWQQFVERFPSDDKKHTNAAHRVEVLSYAEHFSWTPFTHERANMAEQKKGPLDGYRFYTEFSNKGDKTVTLAKFEIEFWKDGRAAPAKVSKWNAVIPKEQNHVFRDPGAWPPIGPGKSRGGIWTLGDIDMPEGWDFDKDEIRLVLKDLWFAE